MRVCACVCVCVRVCVCGWVGEGGGAAVEQMVVVVFVVTMVTLLVPLVHGTHFANVNWSSWSPYCKTQIGRPLLGHGTGLTHHDKTGSEPASQTKLFGVQ